MCLQSYAQGYVVTYNVSIPADASPKPIILTNSLICAATFSLMRMSSHLEVHSTSGLYLRIVRLGNHIEALLNCVLPWMLFGTSSTKFP